MVSTPQTSNKGRTVLLTPDQARSGVGDTVQLQATKGQAPRLKLPCGAFLAQDRSSPGTCGVPSPPGRHGVAGLLQLDLSSEPTRMVNIMDRFHQFTPDLLSWESRQAWG